MSVVIFDEGFGRDTDAEPLSDEELASQEGVVLGLFDRRRLRRYYERLARQCWMPPARTTCAYGGVA